MAAEGVCRNQFSRHYMHYDGIGFHSSLAIRAYVIFQWENEIQEQGIVTFSPIHQTGENLINLLF